MTAEYRRPHHYSWLLLPYQKPLIYLTLVNVTGLTTNIGFSFLYKLITHASIPKSTMTSVISDICHPSATTIFCVSTLICLLAILA